MIGGLDFDVIAPWATAIDGSYYALTDKGDIERRIDGIVERMRS